MTYEKNAPICTIADKEYLKLNEAEAWLSVSASTIYEWERKGLKAMKIGKNKFYSKKFLREFMERVDHIV